MWLGAGGDGHLDVTPLGYVAIVQPGCRSARTNGGRPMATSARPPRRPPRHAGLARPPRRSSTPARRSAATRRRRPRRRSRELDRLRDLQDRLWAEAKQSVLVVLQGIDAAGKDGTISKVMEAFNPQGCPVSSFKVPDARGARPRLPVAGPQAGARQGRDRRSSTARTTRTSSSSASTTSSRRRVWSTRYDQINDFERDAHRDRHDDRQVLPVDRPRRAARALPGALRRPDEALEVLARRPRGAQALGRLPGGVRRGPARRRRRRAAPWYVIPANRKWFRNLAVATILADTIAELKPAYPPAPDLPPNLVIE